MAANKTIKRVVLVVVGIVVVIVAALAIFVYTFDINKYKPVVEQRVSAAVGYNLKIDGQMGLSLFPNLSVEVKGLHLENPEKFKAQAADMVYVEKANVGLALGPLLSKRLEFKDITLTGVTLDLVKPKSGAPNWDLNANKAQVQAVAENPNVSQTATDEAKQGDSHAKIAALLNAMSFNEVSVKNTRVTYHDLGKGGVSNFDNIDFSCGPFDATNKPLKFSFSAKMNNMPISAQGELTSLANILNGEAPFNVALTADKLKANVTGTFAMAGDPMLTAKVEVPAFAPKDVLKSFMKTTPAIIANAPSGAFSSLTTTQDIKVAKKGNITFSGPYTFDQTSGTISGGLTGGAISVKFSGNQLKPALYVANQPMIKNLSLSGLNADAKINGGKISATFNSKFVMDETSGSASGSFASGSVQTITAKLNADKINLDNYLGASSGGGSGSAGGSSGSKAKKPILDANVFGKLNITADIKLAQAIFKGLTVSNANANAKLNQGNANVQFNAALGGAPVNGAFSGNLTAQNSTKNLAVKTSNLQVAPVLKALMGKDLITGGLNADVNVSGSGMDIDDMKRSLSGRVAANLNSGRINAGPGIGYDKITIDMPFTNGKGEFSKGELTGNVIAATFTGWVDLSNDTLDVTVTPTKAAPLDTVNSVLDAFLPKGQSFGISVNNVPIRVHGGFKSIKFDAKPTVENILENVNVGDTIQNIKDLDSKNIGDNLKQNLQDRLDEKAPGAGGLLDSLLGGSKKKDDADTAAPTTEQPAAQPATPQSAVMPEAKPAAEQPEAKPSTEQPATPPETKPAEQPAAEQPAVQTETKPAAEPAATEQPAEASDTKAADPKQEIKDMLKQGLMDSLKK